MASPVRKSIRDSEGRGPGIFSYRLRYSLPVSYRIDGGRNVARLSTPSIVRQLARPTQNLTVSRRSLFLSHRAAFLPADPAWVFVISQFGKRLLARPVGLKRTPIAYRRQFYLYQVAAEFTRSSWTILPTPYLPILLHGTADALSFRRMEDRMKIRDLILSVAFLIWASSASAQTMTEITGRQWMASDKDVREIFVLGYVNGLEQLLSHYNFQIRSGAGKTFDAHVLDEALYKKLLNEPELRSGPIRETLIIVLNDYAVLTDRVGNNLPSWQKLMSTSECAELMKVLYENQKSRMGF